jgi:hypothetical protein
MNFIPLSVSLDEGCISDFIRRYHFEEKDKNDIFRLYKQVMPRIHAEFHYVIKSSGSVLEFDDKYDEKEDCSEEQAVVIATLGQAFDEYQENLLARGDIHKGYMLDCIGLELLWAAYDEIDKKLHEITGKYAGNYIFTGDNNLPMSEVPRLMGFLGQKVVTYNEAYAMIPKKSVLFVVPLLNECLKKSNRCSCCNNVNCNMRDTA